MEFNIRKLDKNFADEYIDFFDNRAFSDGSAEKGCYCVWHHWTDKHEYERSLMPDNEKQYCKRNYTKKLIQNGILNGFVALYNNQITGFCNSDIKDNYFRLDRENFPHSWKDTNVNDKILSIVCFIIDPGMRKNGIAKALLNYACQYAKEHGYDYVEGYPSQGKFNIKNCCGPVSMYTSLGFEIIDITGGVIARKRFK